MTERRSDIIVNLMRDEFERLNLRLDKLDDTLVAHVKADQAVHDVVNRHTTYWKAVGGTIGTGVTAGLAWLGLK